MKPLNQYLLEEPERLTKYKNSLRLNIFWKVLIVLIVVTLTSITLAIFTGLLRTKAEDNQNLPINKPKVKSNEEIIIKNIHENDQNTKKPKYSVIQWFEKHENELIDIDIDPHITNKIKKYEKEINKLLPVFDEASHENKFITNSLLKKLRSKRDTTEQMNSLNENNFDIDPLALAYTDLRSKVRNKRAGIKMMELENALERCKRETKNQEDCKPLIKEIYEYFQVVSKTMEKVKTLLKDVETYELQSLNNNDTKTNNENKLKFNNNAETTLIKPIDNRSDLPIKPIDNKTYSPIKPNEYTTKSPIKATENITYSLIKPSDNKSDLPIKPIENKTHSPIKLTESTTDSPTKSTESITDSINKSTETITDSSKKSTESITNSPIKSTENTTYSPTKLTENITDSPIKSTESITDSLIKPTESITDSPMKSTEGITHSATKSTENITDSINKSTETITDSSKKSTESITDSPIKSTENTTYSPTKLTENITDSPIKSTESITDSPIKSTENTTYSPTKLTENITDSPINPTETNIPNLPKIDNYNKTTAKNSNNKNVNTNDQNDDKSKTVIEFKIKDKPMKFSLFDNIELTTVKESINLSELINFYRAVPKAEIQITVPPTVYKVKPKIKILDGKIPKTKCFTQKIPIKDQFVDLMERENRYAYANSAENQVLDSKIDREQHFAHSDISNLPFEAFKNHPHIHEDVIGDYSSLSYRIWDSDSSYGHDEQNLGQKWYNQLHDQSELHNELIDDSILVDDLPEYRAHAVNMMFDMNFQRLKNNESHLLPVDDITNFDMDNKFENRAHSIDMNFDVNFRGLENNTVHLVPVDDNHLQPIEIPSSNANIGSFTSQPPVAPAATTAKAQMSAGFFPVTGETIKATAQFVMNPSFGIPSMPYCFGANPANFKTYYQPLIIPSPIQIPPTYGQFVQPAYYMIPQNPQNYPINMPGVSVGPFGSTTAAANIANHNMLHYKPPTMPGIQPFNPQQVFCSYMPNSNNPPNPFFRNQMESMLKSVHSTKNENEYPNIPQQTDIIYGSFINQITSQSLEGRNSEQGDSNNHCDSNSIACYSTHQCIPKSNWCDNKVDCTDASDESACSCKSRVHKSRLCDGYPDCPMGEDELGCFGCDKLMYSCYNNAKEYINSNNSSVSMCYSSINRCDGDKNCLNGNDEKECNAILSDIGGGKNTLQPRAFTEGFLHHNFKGKWYPVCGNNSMNWAVEACENEMGKLNEPPQIYTEYGNIPGPFVHSNSYNHEPLLMQNCEENGQSVHIRVKCPPLKCGLTKHSSTAATTTRNKKSLDTITVENSNITEKFKRNDLRIVGGEFCDALQWPFIVGIFRDGKFHCGGIIYNSQWIITAAHCLVGHEQYHFEVQAGLLRRSSYSSNVQKSKVLYAIIHKDYEHKTMKHDLALLNLDKPLKYNRWVRPICLPDKGKSGINDFDWIFGPKPGTLCTAVGWGAIREKGPSSDHLREVTIPILKSCLEKYDNEVYSLCAGENDGGRDACQGDSGGPLFCPSESNDNEWYLAGVVSHGNGCARAGEPGVYTRIALYKKWIESWINNFNGMPKPQKLKQDCPGYFCMWGGGKCIPQKRRCDRYVDCLGGEDEVGCEYPADMVGNIQDITRRPEFDIDETTGSPLVRNNNEELHQNISTVSVSTTKLLFTNSENLKIHSTTPMNEIQNVSTSTNTSDVTSETIINTATPETSTENMTTSKTITTETATTESATANTATTKTAIIEGDIENATVTTENITATTETVKAITKSGTLQNSTTKSVTDPITNLSTKEMFKTETQTTSNFITETTLEMSTESTTNKHGSSTIKISDDLKFLDITTISNEILSSSTTQLFNDRSSTVLLSSAHPELFISTTETNLETSTIERNKTTSFSIQNDQPFNIPTPASGVIELKKLQNGVKPIVPGLIKFRCKRIPQLIDMTTRCDRIVDCEDGSDEENCTCRDYLSANFNSLICDGKPDCEDLSDEKNCEKCTSDQFLCPLSRTCISKSKRCDEKIDCDFKEDELDCFALTDGKNVILDSNRRPRLNPFGYFTRNKNGVWRLMCSYETNFDQNNLNNTDNICKMLGFKGSKTSHTTNPFTNDSVFRTLDNEVSSIDEDMIEKISTLEIISKFDEKQPFHNKQPSYRIPRSLESEKRCNSLFIECSQYSNSQKPFVEIEYSNVLNDDFKHLEPIINPYQKPFAIVKPNISTLIEITNKMDKKEILKNLTEFSVNKFELNSTTEIFNHLINHKSYHYPWSVQIFANGVFQCNGVLLNKYWVAVPAKCYLTWSLEKDWVVALFGGYKTHLGLKGPYEQIQKINCMKTIRSTILLLHLENPIKFSRHVLPTFLPPMNNDHDYIFEENNKNHYNVCMSVTYDKLDKIRTFVVEKTFCESESDEENNSDEFDPPKLCLKGIFNNSNENYKDLSLCGAVNQNDGLNILNDSSVYVPLYRHRHQYHHGIIMCQDDTRSGWYPISFYSKESKKMCENHNSKNKHPSLNIYLEIEPICPEIYNDILKEIENPTCDVYYPLPMLDCSTGFRCPLGHCLPEEKVCDSKPDCYDGSDENTQFCSARKKCSPHELKCHNGNCVPKAKFCDHYNDCGDLTDEPTVCSCLTYLRATDPHKICDGDRNCLDKSDESPAICNCTKSSYKCESSGECIPKDFVCDGESDCPYNEDEQFCYGLEYPAVPHPLNDGFGQLIQQNFGIWHTKCFPRDKPLPTEDDIKEICIKLGFDNQYEKPKFRIIAEDFNTDQNKNSTTQRNFQHETSFKLTENGLNVTRTYLRVINGTAIPINFKDELVKMNDSVWSKRYLDSTKFVLVNKFSPIRLNDNLSIPLKPSRPIGKLVKWNKNDRMNCYRMEIKCQ